jgi:hypothetical protein
VNHRSGVLCVSNLVHNLLRLCALPQIPHNKSQVGHWQSAHFSGHLLRLCFVWSPLQDVPQRGWIAKQCARIFSQSSQISLQTPQNTIFYIFFLKFKTLIFKIIKSKKLTTVMFWTTISDEKIESTTASLKLRLPFLREALKSLGLSMKFTRAILPEIRNNGHSIFYTGLLKSLRTHLQYFFPLQQSFG